MTNVIRVTLTIDVGLLKQLREHVAKTKQSLSAFVSEAAEAELLKQNKKRLVK